MGKNDNKNNQLQIRNSTAEFLIFTKNSTGETIEVRLQNNTIWLTQKLISALFDVDRSVITKHINNIFQEGELNKEATCANFAQVQMEGNRQITRNVEFYNLDVIISVGYRVNSARATAFRQWATTVLRDFALRGYVIDKKRMELIVARACSEKENMGLTSWENAPHGKIVKTDVGIAKNYLKEQELASLGRIVNAYLDLAEDRAKRQIPMTMEDWAKRLDLFLTADDRQILQDSGSITHEIAKNFAETEFEKFRIRQDHLFESDFDKEIKQIEKE